MSTCLADDVVSSREAESSLQGSSVAYVQEAMGWLSDGEPVERRNCSWRGRR